MITKSDKYADYIKDYPSHSTAEQTFYEFPNGYGASVIYGPFTYGLEVAVIKWNEDDTWSFDYSTPVTDDVVGYIEDLDSVLGEIYDLPEDLDTYDKRTVLGYVEEIVELENTLKGLKEALAEYLKSEGEL